jgi:hypothetical protein
MGQQNFSATGQENDLNQLIILHFHKFSLILPVALMIKCSELAFVVTVIIFLQKKGSMQKKVERKLGKDLNYSMVF